MTGPDELAHPDDGIPFRRLIGLRVVAVGAGQATLRLPGQAELANRFGHVHGGALATLVDAAMSNAVLSALPTDRRVGGTVELSIRFLRPARGEVRAEGRTLRVGRRLAFAHADVYDLDGRLVATAQGTYILDEPGAMPTPSP